MTATVLPLTAPSQPDLDLGSHCRAGADYRWRLGSPARGGRWWPATPVGLPVERFLLRAPARPPVPVPEDLPVDPLAYAAAWRALRLMLEVLDRRRPLAQLDPVIDPGVARYLRVLLNRAPANRGWASARLVSMRVCQPHTEAAEVAAVCRVSGRARALAARFERRGSASEPAPGWHCRAIQLG